MAMKDMKRTKAEKKESNSPMKYDGEDYPYGLSVSLDHHSLKKLGMHEKLPKVGDKIKLHAHAHVVSVSDHSSERGENSKRVELQLRHMEVKHGEGKNLEKPDGDTEEGTKNGMKKAMDKILPKSEGDENADGDEA